jgi:TolB protein
MRITLAAGALGTLGAALVAATASGTTRGTNGRIAYAHPIGGKHTTFAISVINPDGTGEGQLTHPADGVLDGQPDWSPDGSKLAFERCARRCAIYTINADGTGLRPTSVSSAGRPRWCCPGAAHRLRVEKPRVRGAFRPP